MYLTSDISIAAYLLTKGHKILEVKKGHIGADCLQIIRSKRSIFF